MEKFSNKSKPKTKEGMVKKRNTFNSVNAFYEGRKLILNAFKSGIFPIKATKDEVLKILSPKIMLQRLPIALAQVKAGNTSEIKQITYSLY